MPSLYPMAPTVLPSALNMPTADGKPRNTTAILNPQWDQWFKQIESAEGQVPDANGVTKLNLSGALGQPQSLQALKRLAQ